MIPVIDPTSPTAATEIDRACRQVGFFTLRHSLDTALRDELLACATEFFALPEAAKAEVSMARGGSAWRGWFPLGGELTSGVPDLKEGFYVGRELAADDPRPLHGANLWPAQPSRFRHVVVEWMAQMESLGQQVLALLAEGLGLPRSFFADGITRDPTPLFRIFRYPPHPEGDLTQWGVGEHSDYGLLTLLVHDGTPGLEVKVGDEWIDVPAEPDLVVCNIGDMLDRLTAGRYRSTPHRVRNQRSTKDRYSLPFFLDPGWNAIVEPLDIDDGWSTPADAAQRWDRADLRSVSGTYGQWLSRKVTSVFPTLAEAVLAPAPVEMQ